jgi:UDP-N-acetylmuramyl pentapeptide phosphotransferase/UDP-N-acetylglucosamine-1-phosphate transferase
VAIFLALVTVIFAAMCIYGQEFSIDFEPLIRFLAIITLILLLGFCGDFRPLNTTAKLRAQLIIIIMFGFISLCLEVAHFPSFGTIQLNSMLNRNNAWNRRFHQCDEHDRRN